MKKTITLIAVAGFIALGVYTAWRTHNGSTDFDTFYYAARHVIDRVPLYTPVKGVSPYIYILRSSPALYPRSHCSAWRPLLSCGMF